MERLTFAVIVFTFLIFACGCRSISVGGSGKVGTVTGGGSVNIPVPK